MLFFQPKLGAESSPGDDDVETTGKTVDDRHRANMSQDDASAKIASAFDQAAATYDANSALQRRVAEQLVDQAPMSRPTTILDIGCGTGHLTQLIMERWPQARVTALDVSQAMLDEVAKKQPNVRTIRCDAAAIATSQKYDLVFSSMALHWLPDPRAALARWARLPTANGSLHVALPIEGSLSEWREACASLGAQDGLWGFPAGDFAEGLARSVATRAHSVFFRSAREFLNSMKKTGAHTARVAHRPMSAGGLRRLLSDYDDRFIATFRVLYLSA